MNLDYYAKHGAALFPLPAGSKAPGNIAFWPDPENPERAGSFLNHYSRDPLQWAAWMALRPGCNFGVVGYASRWIIVDIDAKGEQAEAWQSWADLCAAWGFAEAFAPHVQSARGGWHIYFTVPDDIDPATLKQPDAPGKRINVRVRGYTVAAGSHYDGTAKKEESGFYKLYSETLAPYPAPAALLEHCAPKAPMERTTKQGEACPKATRAVLDWMVENDAIQGDEQWRTIGMVLRDEFGDDPGLELFSRICWNQTPDATALTRWKSFAIDDAGGVHIGTLRKMAKDVGCPYIIGNSFESMLGGSAKFAAEAEQARNKGEAPPVVGYDMSKMPAPQNGPDEDQTDWPTPEGGFAKPSSGFLGGFSPPDYLMDGVMQKRFCYTMTAQTGIGKTTVAMRIAAHVALGIPLGSINIEPGNVMYFAGENPTDIQMRWLGLTRELGIDPASVDTSFFFVPGVLHFSKVYNRLRDEIIRKNINPSLIIVDTAAAYFEGDNDNDNIQAGNHARMLRALCNLPGGPCVLVLAHPTKGAKVLEEMTPRGGGAFLNEVDGNIGLVRNESGAIVAAAIGKFRGPEFTPLHFGLKVINDHPLLVDTKGRQIPTIIAEPISVGEVERRETLANKDDSKVLEALCNGTLFKTSDLAKVLGGWHHEKVKRALKRLETEKLATETADYWNATSKGQKHVNALASVQPADGYTPLTPSNLGPAPYPMPAPPRPPMPPR